MFYVYFFSWICWYTRIFYCALLTFSKLFVSLTSWCCRRSAEITNGLYRSMRSTCMKYFQFRISNTECIDFVIHNFYFSFNIRIDGQKNSVLFKILFTILVHYFLLPDTALYNAGNIWSRNSIHIANTDSFPRRFLIRYTKSLWLFHFLTLYDIAQHRLVYSLSTVNSFSHGHNTFIFIINH